MGVLTTASSGASTAMGYGTTANRHGALHSAGGARSVAMGSGISSADRLVNNIDDSLMVGFNSNAPTLYVGPSAGGSTTGNVGIGTSAPARSLHINDVMRLEPRSSAPASPASGDIYFDSDSNELCLYDGSSWT